MEQRIRELPTREVYERAGRLRPRALEEVLVGTPGQVLDLSGISGDMVFELPGVGWGPPAAPAETPTLGRAPLPPDLGADSPLLTREQAITRLGAMELTQRRIDATVRDLGPIEGGFLVFSRAAAAITAAQWQLGGDVSPFVLVMPGAAPPPPLDLAQLSREIVRSEAVQARCLDALVDLWTRHEQTITTAAQLPNYDAGKALIEIDRVRRAYVEALDAILSDQAVPLLTAAETEHGALERTLLRLQLEHFQHREARYPELDPMVSEVQNWAFTLQTKLAALEDAAPELAEARRTRAPGLEEMERRFVRNASLLALSIEALGEWDFALQAYEYLRGNSALWGFAGAEDIAWRLGQMKAASYDDDVAYLEVLLADHRADPEVAKYFASLPSIVEWSQFAIMMAITLIAVVASAGVGIVVGAGVTSGMVALGAAKTSFLVLGTTFVVKAGAEALVFTIISRSLAAQFPGMAPTSGFWTEFLWNFGLFFSMGLATKGAQALMKLAAASRLATAAFVGATAYGLLEAYGFLRFYAETGDTMNLRQFAKMSVQNAIMLVGLSFGAKAFEPMLGKLEGLVARQRFNSLYGERFAQIDAARSELVRDTQRRIEDNPEATPDQASDLRTRAEEIDARLRSLVEEVATDPRVDTRALQREAGLVLTEVEAVPLAEMLGQAGLDPAVGLRPSGQEAAWSYAAGKTEALVAFLRAQGHEVGPVSTLQNGRHAVEATIAGKGRIQFVERLRRVVPPAGEAPAPGRAGEGRAPGPAAEAAAPPGRTAEQQAQLREITNLRQRVYRWRRESAGDPATLTATRMYLEQLTLMARRAREAAEPSGQLESDIAEMLDTLKSLRPRRVPSNAEAVGRVEVRLQRRAARTRNAEVRGTLEALALRATRLRQRLEQDPSYDPGQALRDIRREERTAGALEYEVYIPLDDPATFAEIEAWIARETRQLLDYPGGEMLRNEMLDQLRTAEVLVLRQSPRQAGREVAGTEQMRAQVEEGIARGRYPPEYVQAFETNRDARGWPRTRDGRPWEVDHVFELWQGGEDNVGNYLPLDPRLHSIKSAIMGRFRARYREAHRRVGEQTDIRETE